MALSLNIQWIYFLTVLACVHGRPAVISNLNFSAPEKKKHLAAIVIASHIVGNSEGFLN